MRSIHPLAAALVLLPLVGCSGDELSRNFGLQRDAPDEFQVTTRAPLSMPPDFTLRAPRPGAQRPADRTGPEAGQAVLAPQAALAAPEAGVTPGTAALLQAAGPRAPDDIRARIDQDSALDRPERGLADRLMFWRTTPPAAQTQGVAVDPQREAQRLRENAALGQPVTEGQSRIIQPRERSLLERLF
jgi:hypothetical protein